MSNFPKVGVEATMPVDDFLKGMSQYLQGLTAMSSATTDFVKAVDKSFADLFASIGQRVGDLSKIQIKVGEVSQAAGASTGGARSPVMDAIEKAEAEKEANRMRLIAAEEDAQIKLRIANSNRLVAEKEKETRELAALSAKQTADIRNKTAVDKANTALQVANQRDLVSQQRATTAANKAQTDQQIANTRVQTSTMRAQGELQNATTRNQAQAARSLTTIQREQSSQQAQILRGQTQAMKAQADQQKAIVQQQTDAIKIQTEAIRAQANAQKAIIQQQTQDTKNQTALITAQNNAQIASINAQTAAQKQATAIANAQAQQQAQAIKNATALSQAQSQQQIAQIQAVTAQYVQSTNQMGQAMSKVQGLFSGSGAVRFAALTGIFAGIGAAIGSLADDVVHAAARIAGAIKDMVVDTAPVETIRNFFYSVSAAIGETGESMISKLRIASLEMQDDIFLMKQFNAAAQLVSTDLAATIPEALGYLTKVATTTGLSLDYLLNSYVVGIGRVQQRILDNMLITVDLEAALARYAKTLGKTTDDLTQHERQAAATAATLAVLKANTENILDPSETYNASIQRLSASWRNFTQFLGEAFLPVAGSVAESLWSIGNILFSSLTNKTRTITDEFGQVRFATNNMHEALINLSAGISLAIDLLGQLAVDVLPGVLGTMGDVAMSMYGWGVSMMASLAEGMAQGLDFLMPVIETIMDILTFWFAPGSPPRIAPDIDSWGAAAMDEWLHGFTEVDFDVLDTIQDKLSGTLDVFAELGRLDEDKVGPAFQELSAMIAEDLAENGKIGEDTLRALVEATGEFGEEMRLLIVTQEELAAAIEAVRAAEEHLAELRKREAQQRTQISKDVVEYNQALRAGASQDVLNAKLKIIQADEKEYWLTQQQRAEAEKAVEVAKEQAEVAEDAAKTQEQIYEELLELINAGVPIEEAIKKVKEEKDKGDKDLPKEIREPLGKFVGQIDSILTEIKKRKEEMRKAFDEMFAPVAERIAAIKARWDEFLVTIGVKPDPKKLQELNDLLVATPDMREYMATLMGEMGGGENAWDNLKKNIDKVTTALGETGMGKAITEISTKVGELDLVAPFAAFMKLYNEDLQPALDWLWHFSIPGIKVSFGFLGEAVKALTEIHLDPMNERLDRATTLLDDLRRNLTPGGAVFMAFNMFGIGALFPIVAKLITGSDALTKLRDVFDDLGVKLDVGGIVYESLRNAYDMLFDPLASAITILSNMGHSFADALRKIVDLFETAAQKGWILTIAELLSGKSNYEWTVPASPYIQPDAPSDMPPLIVQSGYMNSSPGLSMFLPPQTANAGGVQMTNHIAATINNGMDAEMLYGRVTQAVANGLKG